MKYSHDKINRQHGVMKEFEKALKTIASRACVQRIIPGRIARKQSGQSHQAIRFSYFTESGIKCTLVKGGTRQELFIISSHPQICKNLLIQNKIIDIK